MAPDELRAICKQGKKGLASFDASIGSYTYIAEHFPNLWIIENNSSYRGFISKTIDDDYNKNFYDRYIKGAGHLASDLRLLCFI